MSHFYKINENMKLKKNIYKLTDSERTLLCNNVVSVNRVVTIFFDLIK